jgi:hypothetical protein
LDILWFCICAFLVCGALGVIIEHLRVRKWVKDKVLLVIGGLMLISLIVGLVAMWFF